MRRRVSLCAVVVAVVAVAGGEPTALAASPSKTPVDPAVSMYVEQLPTKSGPVAADPSLRRKGAHVESSSNAPIIIVVAVGIVAAAFGGLAFRRLRRPQA